jgi:hypothetical protein
VASWFGVVETPTKQEAVTMLATCETTVKQQPAVPMLLPVTQSKRHIRASLQDLSRRLFRQTDFFDACEPLPDPRRAGSRRIPVSAILLSVLTGFWLKLGSLHALEDRLAVSLPLRRLLACTGWSGAISEDTVAEVLGHIPLTALRPWLHRQCQRELARWGAGRYLQSVLARKLAGVGAAGLAGRAIVAVDGHELFASEHRSCRECRTRNVKKKRKGEMVTVTEYFHSAAFAQHIGAHPALVLDFEPLDPGENELFPTYRLLERMAAVYGRRIGIIVADGAFDGEPFRNRCRNAGWHYVIRCKKINQDPGKTAVAALNRRDPERARPDQSYQAPDGTLYECWEETHHGWRYVDCRRTRIVGGRTEIQQGACVTDLPADTTPPVAVAMIMEARWSIENTGFHELAGAWHFDRAFAHVGRPNAVWAIVLLALLAYNAFQAYVYRQLGLEAGQPSRTLKALGFDLWESLATITHSIARAPPA